MGCIVKNEGTVYSDTTGWELLGDGRRVLVETFLQHRPKQFSFEKYQEQGQKKTTVSSLLFFSFEISVVLKNTDFCFVCFVLDSSL